jgi:hypothetical protein
MSDLRVTNLKGRTPGAAPILPDGAVVTGVVTATTFSGNLTGTASTASFATTSFGLSGNPSISVTGINASGITTVTDLRVGTAVTANSTGVQVGAGKSIRLYGSTSGFTDLIAAAGSASTIFTLPANGGSSGQYLQTNGSGTLSWESAGLLYSANNNETNRTLNGDTGFVSHMSGTFSPSKISNVLVTATFSMTYESGAVQAVCRLLVDGTDYGGFCMSKQSDSHMGGAASGTWQLPAVAAGSHTYDLQVRNPIGGTTCILNYWDGGLGSTYSKDTIMFIYQ